MRTDAADMAGKMIAAANQDLAQASANGDADAQRTIRISATSGYRGSAHQERLWREYFHTKYYPQTAADRAQLPGGSHGEAAVQFMLDYVAPKIAAPGFSNHQAGVAIDLWQERTKGNEIRNSTSTKPVNWPEKWRRTWFFDWLQGNAVRFHFHPYTVEPWHWEYRP
jgi:LAS superfamily LD-carboxypeptidase LdcB